MTIRVTFGKTPRINGHITNRHSDSNGRSLYITNKYILKVDDRGYDHDDLSVWKRIKREDRKYFVPVLAQGYTQDGDCWSVQPLLDLDWDKTEEAEVIVDELTDKYGLDDIHEDNWAMYHGQPVLFDYGMTY